MTRHTPGPWREFRDHEGHDITAGDGRHIASMYRAEEGSPEQVTQDCDARLIAAAPEMLAALQKMLAALRGLYEPWDEGRQPPRRCWEAALNAIEAAEACQAAIAKAGRNPR